MKNKTGWQILYVVFIGILLISCGKKDNSPNAPAPVEKDYIPYQIGNTWLYQVAPTNGDAPYTSTLTVVDTVLVDGHVLAVVKEQSAKSQDDFSLTYFETADNSLIMHQIADFIPATGDTSRFVFNPPATWLMLPFVKNDQWQVFDYNGDPKQIPLVGSGLDLESLFPGQTLTVHLILNGKTIGSENVAAAGQTFEAFKVDFTYVANVSTVPIPISGSLASFWVVPHTGIARIVFYNLSGDITELRTLISYTLL